MTKQHSTFLSSCLLSVLAIAPLQAQAQMENKTELKLRAGGFSEGRNDLGLNDAENSTEFFGEIHGSLFTRYTNDVSTKLRVQAFASTGEVFLNTEDTPQPADQYIALREAWIDIGALTSFPGEILRLGQQRLRQDDALWYDDDALGLNWGFLTTLVQAHLGVAQQVEGFRTDDAGIEESQKDRLYGFGGIQWQHAPGHYIGFRGAYAEDRFDLEDEAGRAPDERRDRERNFAWLGAHVHSDYFDRRSTARGHYWLELMGLTGDERVSEPAATPGAPNTIEQRDVQGTAGSLAFRFRPSADGLMNVGAAYVLADGDDAGRDSSQFEQTGLHSNRSRFTGTRAQIERFSGAAQFNMSNLRAVTGFLAYPGRVFDLSLVYHNFQRDTANGVVRADGLRVAPTTASNDLGDAVDLVISGYFTGYDTVVIRDKGPSGVIRLRTSWFSPGEAYGPNAESSYRAILETSWRL